MIGQMLAVTSDAEAQRYREINQWKDETIFDRFRGAARICPEKIALICGQEEITYGELLAKVEALASNFVGDGIQPGEIVAVQMPNSIFQPLTHLALNAIGAVYMPLHDAFRQAEIGHLMAKASAVAVVMPNTYGGEDYPAMYEEAASNLPELRKRYSVGGTGIHTEPFEDLLELSNETAPTSNFDQGKSDDIGHIMLSSGTTSMPKISVFTNNNILSMMDSFADMVHLSVEDVAAALAPMGTGATGYVFPVLPMLLVGGTSFILERWKEPQAAVDLITKNGCTFATAIPTQITLMLPFIEQTTSENFADFRCFNNAGAPLSHEAACQIEAAMGCRVQSIYGTTDGGVPCMVSIDDPEEKRTSTVGRALPGRSVELRDRDGNQVPTGQAGEICWKTPDKSYGYLNDMEAARDAFDSRGYYKSGDLAKIDDRGFFSIVGRVKDMILRGGQNISPRRIEEMMEVHPKILEVAVAAMPDKRLGERACAFAVLKGGQSLSLAEVVSFLEEKKIVKWQFPERLEILDELPRSPGGKISKDKLTEFVANKMNQEIEGEAL